MIRGPSTKMKKRLNRVTLSIIVIGFVFLIFKILVISVFKGEFYQSKAYAQQLRDVTVNPNRGKIYDTNMKVLAQSATVWTVYISPNDIKTDEKKNKVAEGLSEILNIDKQKILEKTNKSNYYEVIQRKVEKPTADAIRKFISDNNISGINLIEDSKRYYPYSSFASSVIGFTGSDNQGLYGLEAYYDKYLRGVSGRIVSAKNAKGTDMPFGYEKFYEPKDGNSLVLTIDQTIQHFVEKALNEVVETHKVKNRAAAIAMDVNTGAILAMSTKPDFDLNDPFTIKDPALAQTLEGLQGDQLKEQTAIAREKQWKNKAITEIYEPGSVFKIVTGSAALEEKAATLNNHYNCPGYVVVSGVRMNCWNTSGHGTVDFTESFVVSCNPALVSMGSALGANNFFKYFKNYGLTEKTGIDLPGEEQSVYVRNYGPVELASSSFGQSNKITPIQMITAMAATVNGGNLVKPYVVKEIIDSNNNVVKNYEPTIKRQVISKETSDVMRSILEKAVSEKSGSNGYVKGYRIGGKSGTAEKLDGDKSARISSFSAFAPANDPKIVVLLLVDEPSAGQVYGNVVAAPSVAKIMEDTLPYLGILPEYNEEELEQMQVIVPNVVGLGISEAKRKTSSQNLNVRVIGNGEKVVRQTPLAGVAANKGNTVILYTDDSLSDELATVPNLKNMTVTEAENALKSLGFNIKIIGSSSQGSDIRVISQSVEAGTKLSKGSVITVQVLNVSYLG